MSQIIFLKNGFYEKCGHFYSGHLHFLYRFSSPCASNMWPHIPEFSSAAVEGRSQNGGQEAKAVKAPPKVKAFFSFIFILNFNSF